MGLVKGLVFFCAPLFLAETQATDSEHQRHDNECNNQNQQPLEEHALLNEQVTTLLIIYGDVVFVVCVCVCGACFATRGHPHIQTVKEREKSYHRCWLVKSVDCFPEVDTHHVGKRKQTDPHHARVEDNFEYRTEFIAHICFIYLSLILSPNLSRVISSVVGDIRRTICDRSLSILKIRGFVGTVQGRQGRIQRNI